MRFHYKENRTTLHVTLEFTGVTGAFNVNVIIEEFETTQTREYTHTKRSKIFEPLYESSCHFYDDSRTRKIHLILCCDHFILLIYQMA